MKTWSKVVGRGVEAMSDLLVASMAVSWRREVAPGLESFGRVLLLGTERADTTGSENGR